MNETQIGIISIIKSAITGEKAVLTKDFDWQNAIKAVKKHQIAPLIYYGIINSGISISEDLLSVLENITCQCIALNHNQIFGLENIYKAFNESSIEYMPIKGAVIKKLYPKPEMRSMGDADILIKTEQYGTIKQIMLKLGYTEIIESDHELIWNKSNIHIELHKRLIPSYNKDYYAYFGDGWRLAKIKNGSRYSMTDEDQMIYLFAHFAKHYRDAGIGIKHMTDLWVYRKSKPQLDEKYIKKELTSLQLYDFYVNIINTLSVWFENRESDEITDFITEVIFNSGVYGRGEAHILSDAVKISKTTNNVKIKKYVKLTFLPYRSMCIKYPFLKRAPFLLPIMWVYRIITALLFKGDRIKSQKKTIDQISAESINNYQNALNFVGLDFNFKE